MQFKEWLFVENKVEIAYHVTYEKNLWGIQKKGLIPGNSDNWGLAHHMSQSKKGVFFSTKENAIRYWISLYNLKNNDGDEDAIIGGDVPVLLRFRLNVNKKKKDIFGQEAHQDSWFYPGTIPPQGIQYWDGERWKWLAELRSNFPTEKITDPPEKLNPNQPAIWQRKLRMGSKYPFKI